MSQSPFVSGLSVGGFIGALALFLAYGALLHAETSPAPGLVDSRVRTVAYSADQVYRLTGFVGYQIDLQFEDGETFVGLAAGDIEGLSFVAQDNHLFLKPKAASVGTNLTIVTTRHTYQVDYAALSHRPDATEPVVYALRFTYPAVAGELATRVDTEFKSHRAPNIDYWYCGNPSIKPVAASDDGVHTRLRFAPKAEQPAIFILNEDGTESLLNFSMEEGDVILHRVARRLILRRGHLTGCVINKAFDGGGERLNSATVSPTVERTTRGVKP
jgi:type IV secretion system protein VirB9